MCLKIFHILNEFLSRWLPRKSHWPALHTSPACGRTEEPFSSRPSCQHSLIINLSSSPSTSLSSIDHNHHNRGHPHAKSVFVIIKIIHHHYNNQASVIEHVEPNKTVGVEWRLSSARFPTVSAVSKVAIRKDFKSKLNQDL